MDFFPDESRNTARHERHRQAGRRALAGERRRGAGTLVTGTSTQSLARARNTGSEPAPDAAGNRQANYWNTGASLPEPPPLSAVTAERTCFFSKVGLR